MMKGLFYLITLSLIIFSCNSVKNMNANTSSDCNENIDFKSNFFNSISLIEKYTLQKTRGDSLGVKQTEFEKSLNQLSKYVKVSYNEILNYNYSYPSIEIFENDKKKWVEWYETNKCKNLVWE